MLQPRGAFVLSFAISLAPALGYLVWKLGTLPFVVQAVEREWGATLFWSVFAVVLTWPGWLALIVLAWASRRTPLLWLFIRQVLPGCALGAILGWALIPATRELYRSRFEAQSRPFVAALDAYVAEHGAPPGSLDTLALGIALPAWAQRLRLVPLDAERWRYELLLPSPDHTNRFLLLWPASERVKSRDENQAKTFGPWELLICG